MKQRGALDDGNSPMSRREIRALRREFAKLEGVTARLPDETTILRFRHLLERHELAVDMLRVVNDILQAKGLMMRTGTAVDATLISAPSSTKNADGERDPEMLKRTALRFLES